MFLASDLLSPELVGFRHFLPKPYDGYAVRNKKWQLICSFKIWDGVVYSYFNQCVMGSNPIVSPL